MGTHPIFESDFDCLTEMSESFESERKNSLQSGTETVDANHDSEVHDSGSEVEEIMMHDGRERESDRESDSDEKIKDEIMFFLEKGPKSRLEISLNFEKIDDETKIDANLDELDKIGKITHDSDVYSIVNTKAEPNNQSDEPQIIQAVTGGGKVIVEIEERFLNKLDRGELILISKPKDGVDLKEIADQMRRDHFLQYCASVDPMLNHQYQLQQQYQHSAGGLVGNHHQQSSFQTENQN